MARILAADDVVEMREALELALQMAGHEVILCADGQGVLDALQSQSFDALVLDIWMPGIGGLEVMKQVTANHPELPIVVISGGGPNATLENVTAVADLYGAVRVLYKPFDDAELLAAIDEGISG